MRFLKIFGMVMLVAGLLMALMPWAGAYSPQTWYFTGTPAGAPTWTYPAPPAPTPHHKTMTKEVDVQAATNITLTPGQRVWFYSCETALVDVTFPAGEWEVVYRVVAYGSANITTRIHSINATGHRLSPEAGHKEATEAITPGTVEIVETLITTSSFTVPTGGRLAVEVLWPATAGNLVISLTPLDGYESYLISPDDEPGYPVPELSTIILFSMGLLLLGGYAWLKGRQKFSSAKA